MHSSFQPSNPWRPPDARYQRACEIVRGGKRTTRRDDPKVRAAVAFLKRLKRCCTEADLHKLRIEMPELFAAFRIYTEAPPLLRSTLEARLLAAETIPDIALKLGMPAGAVEAFELTFFDVRSRRDNVDFVVHRVIGRPGNEASESELRAFVAKTVAYFFGAKALDTLLYPQPAKDLTGGGMGAALTLVESIQQFKAVMAVQRLRTDDKLDRSEILKAFRRSVNERDSGDSSTAIERHVQAMLAEIPWLSGDAARAALPEDLLKADDCAAELHCDEVMLLAAGELPDQVLEGLASLSIHGFVTPHTSTERSKTIHAHSATGP